MRTLHLNVDDAQQTLATLQRQRALLEETLSRLDVRIRNAIGTDWEGPAAQEFLAEYEALAARLRRVSVQLGDLEEILRREVRQWMDVDARLA
nr:WXG100 family type VII secretion target [Ardenticatena sp.]